MNDDSLEQLLQRADAAFHAPPQAVLPAALLTAVRRRRMRTAGLRSLAAVGAALAIAVPLIVERPTAEPLGGAPPASDWSLKRPVRPADGAPILADAPHDLDALRAEIARLDQEAEERLRIVAAVLRPDVETKEVDSGGALAGLELVRLETARSAALSLQYAVQVEEEFHDLAAARREYQRVAERFPGTAWAQVAATSIRRLAGADAHPSSL